MAAKAVVRDVGRVLDHPYGFVDKLAKLVPFEIGMTLDKALEQEPELKKRYDEEEDVRELIEADRREEPEDRDEDEDLQKRESAGQESAGRGAG